MSQSLQTLLQGLEEAIKRMSTCPYRRTFHSDRGRCYQMTAYQAMLEEHHIFQSMSRKGNCYDNAPMENFFSVLKREIYDGYIYRSRAVKKQRIIDKFKAFFDRFFGVAGAFTAPDETDDDAFRYDAGTPLLMVAEERKTYDTEGDKE